MKISRTNDEAFTGLEAAVVFIAFVVVAAVFSYVVLGAGFLTTQKSREGVKSGVTSAASSIVVKGEVYGIAGSYPTAIDWIQFDIGLAAGGFPVDINRTIVVFSTASTTVTTLSGPSPDPAAVLTAGQWNITAKNGGDQNDLLEADESFTLIVMPPAPLNPRDTFTLEIKPEAGASLGISRRLPAGTDPVMLLY